MFVPAILVATSGDLDFLGIGNSKPRVKCIAINKPRVSNLGLLQSFGDALVSWLGQRYLLDLHFFLFAARVAFAFDVFSKFFTS